MVLEVVAQVFHKKCAFKNSAKYTGKKTPAEDIAKYLRTHFKEQLHMVVPGLFGEIKSKNKKNSHLDTAMSLLWTWMRFLPTGTAHSKQELCSIYRIFLTQ